MLALLHLHIEEKKVLELLPIGFVRFSIRMGWKWVGVDGNGYANTTYISEFHPHIPKPTLRTCCFVNLCVSSVLEPKTVSL